MFWLTSRITCVLPTFHAGATTDPSSKDLLVNSVHAVDWYHNVKNWSSASALVIERSRLICPFR